MLFGIKPSSLGFTVLGIPFIGIHVTGLHPLGVTPTHSSPITALSGSSLWGNPRIPAPPNPASLGSSRHTRIPRRPPAEEAPTTLINLYETRNSREGHLNYVGNTELIVAQNVPSFIVNALAALGTFLAATVALLSIMLARDFLDLLNPQALDRLVIYVVALSYSVFIMVLQTR
jgi:hypothetical protein